MPTERKDEEYGYRTLAGLVGMMVVLGAVTLLFIPAAGDPPQVTAAAVVVGIIWLAVLLVGTVQLSRINSPYRCPQCGADLPPLPLEKSTDYEHRFHCPHCDVLWLTGSHQGD